MTRKDKIGIYAGLLLALLLILPSCTPGPDKSQAQAYMADVQKIVKGEYEFALYNDYSINGQQRSKALVTLHERFKGLFDSQTEIIEADSQHRQNLEQMLAGMRLLEVRTDTNFTPGDNPPKLYLHDASGDTRHLLRLYSGELRVIVPESGEYFMYIYTVDAAASKALLEAVEISVDGDS